MYRILTHGHVGLGFFGGDPFWDGSIREARLGRIATVEVPQFETV